MLFEDISFFCVVHMSVCSHFSSGLASLDMTSTRAGKPWQRHHQGRPALAVAWTRASRPWQGMIQGQPALVKALTRASRPWPCHIQGRPALAMTYPGPASPDNCISRAGQPCVGSARACRPCPSCSSGLAGPDLFFWMMLDFQICSC